jgi:glycerophosphoryl diester phosphodiesterase
LAHRGLWGTAENYNNTVPENSITAIRKASDKCLDGIELDVKMTKDGVPIIMHDFNLGRTTNVYMLVKGSSKYSPETNTGYNPLVSDLTWAQIKTLSLLTPDRKSEAPERVWSVQDALNTYRRSANQIPWIFDVKTVDAVRAINAILARDFGDDAFHHFAMKVNTSLYLARGAYNTDAKQARGIPVFVTNNLSQMNVPQVYSYWAYVPGHAVEINVKENGGNLSDIFNKAKSSAYGVGAFNALPDYDKTRFFNANGSCCYKLSDKYSNGDRSDKRGDFSFIKGAKFTFITTDQPLWLAQWLGQ